MNRFFLATAAILLRANAATTDAQPEAHVATEQGELAGTVSEGIASFKGSLTLRSSFRRRCGRLASATSRVGAITSPVLVGALYPILGFPGVFVTALVHLLARVLCALLWSPRPNNLSLE